jgi:flavodoxin I
LPLNAETCLKGGVFSRACVDVVKLRKYASNFTALVSPSVNPARLRSCVDIYRALRRGGGGESTFIIGETVAEIGLFFGSDDGNTESVAYRIQSRFGSGVCDVYDISNVTQLEFTEHSKIILGIPTWDFGQIQSDWEDFWGDISEVDFSGVKVALFGLGDQFGYGDFFLDAMGMLHDLVQERGAKIVGHWPTGDYEFDASKAQIPGEDLFVGLGIDEDQQSEQTAERLNLWCQQLAEDFGIASPVEKLDD